MCDRTQIDSHLVVVGEVVGFWKLDGHIKIKPLTSNPHRLDVGNCVIIGNKQSFVATYFIFFISI